ncbi:MAG: mannose-1-phosphate guanylyltransferase [Bacteroidales bacterium]
MDNRYCVIMSGGIGSRFWPVSRPDKPKQFLNFFGTGKTLLQMTYERFLRFFPKENIFISTNTAYRDLVHKQIDDIDDCRILCEPQRRNTAPCIAFAVYHIKAIDPNAVIVVTPSDHLILREDIFGEALMRGMDFAASHDALLTLGLKPTRPETGYGYIQIAGDCENGINRVKTFTEKPNRELAEIFIESGEFFWNSGVFIWNVKAITAALELYLPDITTRFEAGKDQFGSVSEQDFINEAFPTLPNISVDFGLMEKASNVYVLCAELGWADVGSWNSLYEIAPKDHNGNADHGRTLVYESSDNIISAHPDKLVIIDGLENYIVADSKNVLIVCRKGDENRIRQIVNDVKDRFGNEYM